MKCKYCKHEMSIELEKGRVSKLHFCPNCFTLMLEVDDRDSVDWIFDKSGVTFYNWFKYQETEEKPISV